jgi:hypothetical protein
MTKPLNNGAGVNLLTQEYQAALRELYSEALTPDVRQHRVQELKAEYERQRALEMKAIRAQWEADTS